MWMTLSWQWVEYMYNCTDKMLVSVQPLVFCWMGTCTCANRCLFKWADIVIILYNLALIVTPKGWLSNNNVMNLSCTWQTKNFLFHIKFWCLKLLLLSILTHIFTFPVRWHIVGPRKCFTSFMLRREVWGCRWTYS